MRVVGIVLSGAIVLATLPALAGTPGTPEVRHDVETRQAEHSDTSAALRDMPQIPVGSYDDLDKKAHEVKKWPAHHARIPLGSRPDPLASKSLQRNADGTSSRVAATAGLNFDGTGNPNYTITGAPPDTVGAIGDTQYVQSVNQAFSVYDKTNGTKVYGPVNNQTLWSGFGGRCETDNDGDPIVMFDKAAHRWVISQFAVSASPYYQCIAVSTTADATGSYRRFSYSFGTDFNDYGKAGVWPDGYYFTYNMFANGQTFSGAKVCAYDRVNMLSASGTPGAQQCFQLSTTYGGLQPADIDGNTAPPAGSPNYVMGFDDTALNGIFLWKFKVNWTTPSSSTFTGPTKITTASFTEACAGATCITQPGTTQKLDSLADRLMYRLAYRNFGSYESLLLNHSVDVSGHSGVRWYEVRSPNATPTLYQQGTFSPDTNHRWMGSIAQDKQGNIMLGYSTSGTVKPSVRYTGRLVTDALGTMQAETEMFAGTGVQTGSSLSRWGDYSNLTVDPVDDCTFWYTQEYIKANGAFNWSTRIGSFKFPGCGGVPTADFSASASPSSASVQQGNNATSTITITSTNSFNAAVALTASGLPSGATASFSPSSVTPAANGSATSTLTLATATSTPAGTYSVTITGTSGSTTHQTSVSLTVTPIAVAGTATYDATSKAPKCGTVGNTCDSGTLLNGRATLGPESNAPNTINSSCADGTSGTYHGDESNDKIKVFTTDGSNFAAGKTVTVQATVWAYSSASSDKLDLYYAASASSPTWTLIGTLTPAAGGVQTLSANYVLPSGSLQAVRANFRYQGSASSCSTGSYDDHDDLVFAVGAGAPDTTAPTTAITAPANGATVSGTVSVTASGNDNVGVTKVEFYIDGALAGSDTTSPYAYSWNTSTWTGSHTLTSKAYDAAGNVGTSAAVSVTIATGGATAQTAVYDATLKAPKCGTVGISCDSSTLINGRGSKGPEPNASNTINASCTDGASGTYHSDESTDRLKVATSDGSALAHGKTVTITATLWAYSKTSDTLDLYYTANASSPAWTLIASLKPTATGATTLTKTYVLPTGSLQAIRANFRYNGSASTCTTGSYDDHDDLVFAVQ
jgi:hypothetical protein